MALQEVDVKKTFTLNGAGYGKKRLQEIVKKQAKGNALFNILCLVTGYSVVPNKKDPSKSSLRFEGQFECVDVATGEETIAAQAFIPGPAEAFLKAQFDAAGENASIRQALVLIVDEDPRDDAITGYKFNMKGFVDKKAASDVFAELRGVFPALPKGKKA